MRILIDENVPVDCRHWFPPRVAETVGYRAWRGIRNGALLERAVRHGFTVFLTCDQSIPCQQAPELLSRVGLVLLPTNDWTILRHLAEETRRAAVASLPGTNVKVAWPTQ